MRKVFGIVSLLVLATPLTSAQLLEVRQTIFGMDCAPCARGVEQSIKRLAGVQAVTISLNNGTAEIRLAPENHQTLRAIRQRIEENGFTPKDAKVTLHGRTREKDGKLLIETESGEFYFLEPSPDARELLEQMRKEKPGSSVTVVGSIAERKAAPPNAWELFVTHILH